MHLYSTSRVSPAGKKYNSVLGCSHAGFTFPSAEDGTVKYLLKLKDGNAVESVLMKYHYGNTICISTQVGCRQGCAFCASGIGGLVRQMEPSEMLNELVSAEQDSGEKISRIVLMGTGEPLDNFENVMRFLALVNHPDVMNIGMRHISLSTCGLIERGTGHGQESRGL